LNWFEFDPSWLDPTLHELDLAKLKYFIQTRKLKFGKFEFTYPNKTFEK